MTAILNSGRHLGYSNGYITVRNDVSYLQTFKGTHDHSNRPTELIAGTKTLILHEERRTS